MEIARDNADMNEVIRVREVTHHLKECLRNDVLETKPLKATSRMNWLG